MVAMEKHTYATGRAMVAIGSLLSMFTLTIALAACGSSSSGASDAATDTAAVTESTLPSTTVRTFKAEVWADNWFALYNGDTPIGEDSVSIATERSFNAETFTFESSYPLELRAVSKDFKENDTGLEYIGTGRQQMGDGGFIVQITDLSTGRVVAVTDESWKGFVVHAAPLNDCADSETPEQTCTSRIVPEPADWKAATFDDSSWAAATFYSEDQVGVKDGYESISWDSSAKLIWTSDLKVDNTILWRKTVQAPA